MTLASLHVEARLRFLGCRRFKTGLIRNELDYVGSRRSDGFDHCIAASSYIITHNGRRASCRFVRGSRTVGQSE
jgi:hypothetical protein